MPGPCVHALLGDGASLRAIGARLGLARGTVRRFAVPPTRRNYWSTTAPAAAGACSTSSNPTCTRRWNEGCTNATQLFGETSELGYRGSEKVVLNYLHPFRSIGPIPRPARKPPSVRRLVSWMMRDPARLDAGDRQRLDQYPRPGLRIPDGSNTVLMPAISSRSTEPI